VERPPVRAVGWLRLPPDVLGRASSGSPSSLAFGGAFDAPVLVEDGFEEFRWRERASRLR